MASNDLLMLSYHVRIINGTPIHSADKKQHVDRKGIIFTF